MTVWIIFGVLITILILFFLYSYIKDKKNKKKIKQEKALFEAETIEYYGEMVVTINEIIERNNEYIDEFEVSVGKYKMGQITDATRKIIDQILSSSKFRGFFSGNDQYVEFVRNIVFLKDLKSNNWQKKAISAMDYFKNECQKIEDNKVDEIKQNIREEITKKYHEELVK